MRRIILFVLAIAMIVVLTTTPPLAARTAEPLLKPSVPILDIADKAAEVGETISQIMDWLLGTDDDKAEEQYTASQT